MPHPQDLPTKSTEAVKSDDQSNPLSSQNISSDHRKEISRNFYSSESSLSTKYPSSAPFSDQLTHSSSTSNAINLTRPTLTYPSSSVDNLYQLQPRNSINPMQSGSIDAFSSQFQFPTSQSQPLPPQQQLHSPNNHNDPLSHTHSPYSGFQYSQSTQFAATPTQQLPQLNFPTNAQPSTSYFMNYNSFYSQPNPHELSYQSRSHSYAENYTSVAQNRRYNWSLDQTNSLDIQQQPQYDQFQLHKTEQFTPEDIHVLKSLLFNGEKVKWRYVSSKLSAVTGRRATSTACCKKTRELFKLPSERVTGSLGTSLPYVVHGSWSSIDEEE